MATQKPISTISYNTESFLVEKLDLWVKSHIIQSYMYICHKGEDGDKNHIHLRIEPNKKLDPMSLTEELSEYDPIHPLKPLTIRPWRQSKEEDWILYAVHDANYLAMKYGTDGEKGEKLPYDWSDIKAPASYDVEIAFIRAKSFLKHSSVNMVKRLQSGESPVSLLLQGESPFMVSTIARALSINDYQRLSSENLSLRNELESLYRAIDSYGLKVVCEDGFNLSLHPHED